MRRFWIVLVAMLALATISLPVAWRRNHTKRFTDLVDAGAQ